MGPPGARRLFFLLFFAGITGDPSRHQKRACGAIEE
jgi:hypothetical protein